MRYDTGVCPSHFAFSYVSDAHLRQLHSTRPNILDGAQELVLLFTPTASSTNGAVVDGIRRSRPTPEPCAADRLPR